MGDATQVAEDLATLERLNLDYADADQSSAVARFSEFLAEDFLAQTPGVTRDRAEFLDYIAQPRPFKDLGIHDVKVGLLGDVALIDGRSTDPMVAEGTTQEALCTDACQKRGGTSVCVSACAIAPGT